MLLQTTLRDETQSSFFDGHYPRHQTRIPKGHYPEESGPSARRFWRANSAW